MHSSILAFVFGLFTGAVVVYAILNLLIRKYKAESLTDSLTGLYNSREFKNKLQQETERAKRYALPFTILLIDVDHFKSINEQWGYKTADQLLCDLVSWIQKQLRSSDLFFRYKLGDEFVVMALNTDISGAKVLSERIKKSLESKAFQVGKTSKEVFLRVSIGLSEFDTLRTDKSLEKEAEDNLRKDKQSKNKSS